MNGYFAPPIRLGVGKNRVKDDQARFLASQARRAKTESSGVFLAGEKLRVFETSS
jgi:hypothetical protein